MTYSPDYAAALSALKAETQRYETFLNTVEACFKTAKHLVQGDFPAIYAVKSRVKSDDHILRKIDKKRKAGIIVTPETIFREITDYCGVRVLHMHIGQFQAIHELIMKNVRDGDFVFHEPPTANFWDPDLEDFYRNFGLAIRIRDTLYTSVHYLVKPRPDVPMVCEIQVRTLFEEIWGEVDHYLNYPEVTKNDHCRRQLRVLSKMVCSGSRLVDSIFDSHKESEDAHSLQATKAQSTLALHVRPSPHMFEEKVVSSQMTTSAAQIQIGSPLARRPWLWRLLWIVLALAWLGLASAQVLSRLPNR